MSEQVEPRCEEEVIAQRERLERNLAVVCSAATAAGGSKITGTISFSGGEEKIDFDHDLPTDELFGCDIGAVPFEDVKGLRQISLGDAMEAVMIDLSRHLIEDRLGQWKVEATLDAEQLRLSAQSFVSEDFQDLRSELRSVMTRESSSPTTPTDAAMHRIHAAMREMFTSHSKFLSDIPGVERPDDADAWNRSVVLSALKRAGIEKAVLTYAGSGDSGDKWELSVEGLSDEELSQRLESRASLCIHDCHGSNIMQPHDIKVELATRTLGEAINLVAEHIVSDHHFGYEEQNGAGGAVVFDVMKADILWSAFDWQERYVPRKHMLLDIQPVACAARMRP